MRNLKRGELITDHKFVPSEYCDCSDCSRFCHYHYGLPDACLKDPDDHVKESLDVKTEKRFS